MQKYIAYYLFSHQVSIWQGVTYWLQNVIANKIVSVNIVFILIYLNELENVINSWYYIQWECWMQIRGKKYRCRHNKNYIL